MLAKTGPQKAVLMCLCGHLWIRYIRQQITSLLHHAVGALLRLVSMLQVQAQTPPHILMLLRSKAEAIGYL